MRLRLTHRSVLLTVLLLVASFSGKLQAEKVSALPTKPTGYVNDYAGVLSDEAKQQLDELAQQVDTQAHAQIAIVTIKTLDGASIEEFSNDLFQKWGVGAKGTDRGVLVLLAIEDHKRRIEVGYGLEGILPDGKVGDIGRSMVPDLREGNYDDAMQVGVGQIAQVIADDAHVKLSGPLQTDALAHREEQSQSSPAGILIFFTILVIVAAVGGRSGLLWFLLGNLLGGGFGGGGNDREGGGWGGGDSGGGGFGGFGGGSSGGGGASGSW